MSPTGGIFSLKGHKLEYKGFFSEGLCWKRNHLPQLVVRQHILVYICLMNVLLPKPL